MSVARLSKFIFRFQEPHTLGRSLKNTCFRYSMDLLLTEGFIVIEAIRLLLGLKSLEYPISIYVEILRKRSKVSILDRISDLSFLSVPEKDQFDVFSWGG